MSFEDLLLWRGSLHRTAVTLVSGEGRTVPHFVSSEEQNGRFNLEPVQKLLRDFWAWADGVVPLWADIVASQLKGFELGV